MGLIWSEPYWTLRLDIATPFTEGPCKGTMLCKGRKWCNVSWIAELSQQTLVKEHNIGKGKFRLQVFFHANRKGSERPVEQSFQSYSLAISRSMSRQLASAENAPLLQKTDDIQSIAASDLCSASSRFGSSPTLGVFDLFSFQFSSVPIIERREHIQFNLNMRIQCIHDAFHCTRFDNSINNFKRY
jgi:CRP-like cAMP-binding protein